MYIFPTLVALLLRLQLCSAVPQPNACSVHTSSGLVTGHQSSLRPEVNEYLGIPFAKPPVGSLRWAPPSLYSGTGTINATQYKPDCPATFVVPGQAGPSSSEDCLYLNVWTPQSGGTAGSKTTMIWLYGGGFVAGSSALPSTNGAILAAGQDVIVIAPNYRVGIFGFPGAPGLGSQNLGLLDQRLAIEWILDNIVAFGGDKNKIILFGQSAGAVSIDLYSYAYTSDPIVQGFIGESGAATTCGLIGNQSFTSWANVSTQLGCGTGSSSLPCMKQKTEAEITAVAGTLQTGWVPSFAPSVDGKNVFDNYDVRGAQGAFIKKPYLIGNNDHESGPGLDILADAEFVCPAAKLATDRANAKVSVWRYRYFGGGPYSTITPTTIFAAIHGAEISYVFGTVVNATAIQSQVSMYMMKAWASFAKQPGTALSQLLGWPTYKPTGNTLVRLFYQNQTTASFVGSQTYDGNCTTLKCSDVLNIVVPPV